MKIKLLDDTQKTILLDESLTVTALVDIVGEKMGIGNPEEFSLQLEGAKEGNHEDMVGATHFSQVIGFIP